MRRRRIGADDDDDVRILDGIEVLGAGRGAVGLAEAVAGRRVADAGAGVDVIVAEALPDQLLDEVGLLVGAARRGDAADRALAVLVLDAAEFAGDVLERLIPRHLAPRVRDLLADHRVEDALLVGGVAIGEAALHAGMAAVCLAVLPGNHAHQLVAAHFRLERAADAAIGTGGDDRMLRLADGNDAFLGQRRGRAGLDAGAARHAFRLQERLVHAWRHARFEPATFDGQREGALHLLAGPHAARTDDALGRIVGEVRVRLVLRHPAEIRPAVLLLENVVVAFVAVAHVAQADDAGHVLQLAVAVRRAGQAVERMVGDIELHDAAAYVL